MAPPSTERVRPVAVFTTVTVGWGMAAPLVSYTRPSTVTFKVWAKAGAHNMQMPATTSNLGRLDPKNFLPVIAILPRN
jgi:hypothetical protein